MKHVAAFHVHVWHKTKKKIEEEFVLKIES